MYACEGVCLMQTCLLTT